jgi:hypothetical protein
MSQVIGIRKYEVVCICVFFYFIKYIGIIGFMSQIDYFVVKRQHFQAKV